MESNVRGRADSEITPGRSGSVSIGGPGSISATNALDGVVKSGAFVECWRPHSGPFAMNKNDGWQIIQAED